MLDYDPNIRNALRKKQGGFLLNPWRFASGGGGGGNDPDFNSVVSLLHFDGTDGSTTFTDVKGLSWTASGAAQIDTSQSKFGTSAVLFDGTDDQISTSGTGFEFGAGDFTIECWVRFSTVSGLQFLMSTSGSPYIWIEINNTSAGKMTAYIHGTNRSSTNDINANQWYHVAISRASGAAKFFLDGVQQGTDVSTSAGPAGSLRWGGASGLAGSSSFLNGWIDEARVTKGVARYTANFTPPTAAFPDS